MIFCFKLQLFLGEVKLFEYLITSLNSIGFPCGSAGKESACNAGDQGLIHRLGRSPGERKGYPLQCSGLENSLDCIVHGVAKSRTRLSNFQFIIIIIFGDVSVFSFSFFHLFLLVGG